MGMLIYTSGETKEVKPKNGKDYKLKELQSFVDGYIEIAHIGNGEIMVLNEEGAINGMELNKKATEIYRERCNPEGYIFGDVLICKNKEVK